MTPQQDRRDSRSQSDLLQLDVNPGPIIPGLARPERLVSLGSSERTVESSGQAYSIAGTWGMAYAGGALSGPVPKPTCNQDCESSEPHCRGSVRRDPTPMISVQQPSPKLEVQHTDSPKYSPSLSNPGAHASFDSSDERLPAQPASLSPNSPAPRQGVPCAESLRSTPHSVSRISITSLPVQEKSEDRRTTLSHELEVRDPGREHHVASPSTPSSDPLATNNHNYPHSPHSRPGAPIPPSSYSYTTTISTSPSLLVSGMSRAEGKKPVLPPYSPVPRVDSSYPYPFAHIRRRSYASSDDGIMCFSQMNPNVVGEQLVPAPNNGGMVSDSTLPPSSTPLRAPPSNPRAFIQTSDAFGGRRGVIANSQASKRSSPSHQHVPLPPFIRGNRGRRRREHSPAQDLRRQSKTHPPPRVESTQPRDTSSELLSGGETPRELKDGEPHRSALRQARLDESADDEDEAGADADGGEWVDEDIGTEGIADDLLQLEFHPDYVRDPKKRRRRWNLLWDSLLRDFHALDHETNTTLMLLAAPFHTGKLHSVASRAVRRDSSRTPTDMKNVRSSFAEIASRQLVPGQTSLLEQLTLSSGDERSSGAREENLLRALDTAIGSLHTLGSLYERREMLWVEEKHRLDEDKEKVEQLLNQVLGVGIFDNLANKPL